MRNMKRVYRKNRILIWACIIFLFLIGSYFTLYREQLSWINTVFRDIGATVQGLFISKRVDYTGMTNQELEALRSENQDLKKLLELKTTMSDYRMIPATVVIRDMDYWFQTFTIDKGKKDGIQVDMAVITDQGLVGRVISVGSYSSVVKMITASDQGNKIAVSVEINQDIYNGILQGYDPETDTVLVTSIRSTSDIEIGSTVRTNGLGSLFPKGLYVGEVVEITNDDLGVSKVLKVKSKVSFENLHYVMVVERNGEV